MKAHYAAFARYNAWANRRLYDAAAELSDADYRADRGAFFKSMHGTLNHLLTADWVWMHRFNGQGPSPDRLDMITAFAHVSNWYLYVSDAITEAVVHGRSSVLNHFWSLSVEEQFYVLIAIISVWLVRTKRRPPVMMATFCSIPMWASYNC